jgi:hypothetical protein
MILILIAVAGFIAVEAFGDAFGLWLSGYIGHGYLAAHGSALIALALCLAFTALAIGIKAKIRRLEREMAESDRVMAAIDERMKELNKWR